ncbi:unnamed protein product [Microthlaspi erraticum]|uniref:Uncharacterized protein n=1 Tax=Microthlaspi erraticum TaxID=1685480 RepID=A0A6D2KY22_9BRAS|nr:unnamed protein product [Microthlaspi erraticum]
MNHVKYFNNKNASAHKLSNVSYMQKHTCQVFTALAVPLEKLENFMSSSPDHCSSAHNLHTLALRISIIYIHACKHFKRATIARNSVSGL